MKQLLIIGANSDIAKAIARKYAELGYSLTLSVRQPDTLDEVVKDLTVRGAQQVIVKTLDVTDQASISNFLSDYKEPGIDGVIVAVGYLGDQAKAQTDANEQAQIISANYSGLIEILEVFATQFEQRKSGFIVGISSVAGDRGRASNYHYGAAKAAFSAYLSGLRNRLFKSGVSVCDVRPGFVDTKMTSHLDLPAAITATPQEVAECVVNAQIKGKGIVYVKSIWWPIMFVIRHIPELIFKRLSL